ncbi:hypothetical protein F4782DRAFT_539380 [Xylaria castorea]|nr:hypothetical protein F4782DRAFT_539380 [Xylaria castorea]
MFFRMIDITAIVANPPRTQPATNRFFGGLKSPSQMQCDEIAQSVSGALTVRPVDSPGSMSYTVVCNGRPGQQDLILSFREPGATLDEEMVKLAKEIHGDLGADPPLSIYSMPYLRDSSYIEVLAFQVEMNSDEEAKHKVFIQHLAWYFARCRLARLAEELPSSLLPNSLLSKLIGNLPSLFSQNYPQVLTHGDFSVTNILIDENTFEITGIVNWSLAMIMPFGMGLAEVAGQIGAILAFRRNADGSPSEEVLVSESRMKQLRAWFGGKAAKLT